MGIQVLLAYSVNSLRAHLSAQLGYHLAYDNQSDAHVTLRCMGFNPYTRDGEGYFIHIHSLTHLLTTTHSLRNVRAFSLAGSAMDVKELAINLFWLLLIHATFIPVFLWLFHGLYHLLPR